MVFSWRIRSRAPADAPPGMVRVSPIRVITPKTLLAVVPQVPLIVCPPCYRHPDDVLLIGTRRRVCFTHVVPETRTARSERTSSTAPGALQVASSPARCCAQPGPAARHRQSLIPHPWSRQMVTRAVSISASVGCRASACFWISSASRERPVEFKLGERNGAYRAEPYTAELMPEEDGVDRVPRPGLRHRARMG